MTRRVGVNLAWLVPGVVGGSEEATTRALGAVGDLAVAAGIEVVVFGLPSLTDAHPALVERFEFHPVGAAGGSKVRRVAAETVDLPRLVARAGVDMVHHAGGVIPLTARGRVTLAVHDTQPLDLPDNFSAVKRRYLGAMVPSSVRRADLITVPSRFVLGRLVDGLGADPDRIAVVPWSVPRVVAPAAGAGAEVRRRHGLGDRRFVLYPAIAYLHKNHAVLLDAVAAMGRDGGAPVDLVLTGAAGPLDAEVAERAAAPDLAGRVHVLGRVPAGDLAVLLAEADAVAVPSRYEGFGLPALEALAAGRPTVVADAGSLPEVVDGAALVVDPDDVEGWAAALRIAVDDPAERARLVDAGLAVAASGTPERTATALIDVWLRCLGGDETPPRTVRNPS
ncbi:MAG TPA: glycosyltransferase family 1 protein [Microthrixaceae bacterium]|nr:glycosyltransferase family 1 protein [Microthrixaceae bacterium]